MITQLTHLFQCCETNLLIRRNWERMCSFVLQLLTDPFLIVSLVIAGVIAWMFQSGFLVLTLSSPRDTKLRQLTEARKCQSQNMKLNSHLGIKECGASELSDSALERKRAFLRRAGSDYGYRSTPIGYIDDWRPREIPGLIRPLDTPSNVHNEGDYQACMEVYLDHGGAALPHRQQLQEILKSNLQVLANPHSTGPAAVRTTRLVEQVKKRLLDLWNGQPGRFSELTKRNEPRSVANDLDHPGYELIFTSGTTQSLRILAESFPWESKECSRCNTQQSASTLVYPMNSHTSVIGMRGPALARGANFECLKLDEIENAIDRGQFDDEPYQGSCSCRCKDSNSLNMLVLPSECNFSGERVDIHQLILKLNANREKKKWWTTVDLAKHVCTSPIDLRHMDADFACLSFYKVFGEPTGLGCLLVKRTALHLLARSSIFCGSGGASSLQERSNHYYFGGGSVNVALPQQNIFVPRGSKQDRGQIGLALTHGTTHFRGIVALGAGLNVLDRMGGMSVIQNHTRSLFAELYDRLKALLHSNGSKAICFYSKNTESNGPTVAFNILRSDGTFVGYNEVSKLASLNRPPIQLRTGCFCNPGGCQMALDKTNKEVLDNYTKSGHICGDDIDVIEGKPTGAVRVSIGKDNSWEDIDVLVSFLKKAFVSESLSGGSSQAGAWDSKPKQVVLSELFVYPIKSCRAQRVKKWTLDSSTCRLLFDREFALVDSLGTAMRLQRYPKMAYISPEIDLDQRVMKVSAPQRETLTIMLDDDLGEPVYKEGTISVCGNRCGGIPWGGFRVSQWFSNFLGVQCWLAKYSPSTKNYHIPSNVLANGRGSVAFANEQPLLMISEHAVEVLNNVLLRESTSTGSRASVTSRHFRPNLVVRMEHHQINQATKAHAEDSWSNVLLVNSTRRVEFDVVGQCARCSMVDVDPSSGSRGNALRALADYRRSNGQITFGIFLRNSRNQVPDEKDSSSRSRKCTWSTWLEEGDAFSCQ